MEWITEVSIAWNLEGSLPFLAARFVDAYNAAVPLSSLKLLQLVGISALRVAMSYACPRSLRSATPWPDSSPPLPPLPPSATDEQAAAQRASMLELHHFTDMCADAYTGQDVEAMCAAMGAVLAPQHRTARTAKHYLRSCLAAAAREQELLPPSLMAPVRYLSGFLLHLSLVSVECCAACPAQLAAAALSVALETLGLPPWHPALQRRVFATLPELEPLRARLQALQETAEVRNLRCQWRQLLKHVVHRYAQRAAVEAAAVAGVEADAGAVEAAEVAAEAAAAEGAGGGGVVRDAGGAGVQVFAGVAELGHVRRLVKAAGPMVRFGKATVG